jgi:hypothetical protein
MVVNGNVGDSYNVGNFNLVSAHELRFLGVIITHAGEFIPTQTDYSKALWSLFNRVKNLGLSSFPSAYIRAYQTFI